MLYSGIDLHKDNCVISTVNQDGKMIKQSKLPNHNISIIRYFSEMGKQHKAVVESTANWYWLSDLLKENGIDIILAHAKYLKAISYANILADAESRLSGIAKNFENDLDQLQQLRRQWTDLQATAISREAPDDLVGQTDATLREIDEFIGLVEDRRNEALSLLVEISESTSRIAAFRDEAAAYRRSKRRPGRGAQRLWC